MDTLTEFDPLSNALRSLASNCYAARWRAKYIVEVMRDRSDRRSRRVGDGQAHAAVAD
jgi:hypothetical protein